MGDLERSRAQNDGGTDGKTIGIGSSYYLPHLGGVEQYTDGLATALAAMGHRIIILTCDVDNNPGVAIRRDGGVVCRVPARNIRDRFPVPRGSFKDSEAWRRVAAVNFDGIIVNTRLYPLSLYGVQLAHEKGIVPIVVEHGSGSVTLGNAAVDLVFRTYEKWLFRKIAAYRPQFCGVSQKSAEWLGELGVKAAGVIPNAIDAEGFREQASARDFRAEFGISDKTSLIVFAGRLIREKGVMVFSDMASMMSDRKCEACFAIAGDGPERAHLEACIGPDVHMLGRLDRPDMAALLRQADVFCFPSMYPEGLPTSLLEAAACEAYIVSTDVAGARDVVPGRLQGTILSQASAEQFADAVEAAIGSAGESRQAAEKCRRHIEESLSWNASAKIALGMCVQVAESV